MSDLISRQEAIDFLKNQGAWKGDIMGIEALPAANEQKLKDDLISRQATINALREYITEPNISDDESEIKGYNDGLETAIAEVSRQKLIEDAIAIITVVI